MTVLSEKAGTDKIRLRNKWEEWRAEKYPNQP